MNSLFASTARGLEELLKTELENLGAVECQVVQGGVHFKGDTRLVYQSLMWSRLASRIMLPLGECKVYSDLDLYLGVQAINWTEMFNPGATFAVHFSGLNDTIRNSQYGAMKVKDAIVDAFTRKNLPRPNVDRDAPDIRVNVWLHKETASIALDLSGDGLHLRGYRDRAGIAPIKETLAAAIVMRSGWQPGTPLLDPMCGSGTLLIEAAMLATDRAPGLHRGRWGFSGWTQHDEAIWQEVKAEAQTRARKGLAEYSSHFYGSDSDARVIQRARTNARLAGIGELITFEVNDVAQLANPLPKGPYGTVLSNPPYGERISTNDLLGLYQMIGERLKHAFVGNEAWVLSYREECFDQIGLKASQKVPLFNGPLECEFRKYEIFDGKYKEFKSQEEGEEKKEAEGEQTPRFREKKEFKPRREGEFKPRRDGESRPRREGEYKPRREGGEFKGGDGRDRKPRGEFRGGRDSRGPREFRGNREPRIPKKEEE